MPLPPVLPFATTDLAEVRIVQQLHGQVVMTTFHYKPDAGGADLFGWLEGLLLAFETDVYEPIRASQSNEVIDSLLFAQFIVAQRYRHITSEPAQRNGQYVSSSLPSGAAAVVRRQGVLAGRTSQGRIYIPGIPVSAENDSRLSSAYLTARRAPLEAAVTASLMVAGMPTADPILSPFGAGAERCYFSFLDDIIRYQRRREIGVGI